MDPEQLLLASLSQRHMLWYLHLAADAGVTVTAYSDTPTYPYYPYLPLLPLPASWSSTQAEPGNSLQQPFAPR